jgi:hypothetical protein
MRISTALVILVAIWASVGLIACDTGTSKPKDAVWFGPGSAPNMGSGVGLAGVGMFVPAGAMNEARVGHTATTLNNGLVLVVGGRSAEPFNDPNNILIESELYDPATDTWTQVSQLPANAGTDNGFMMSDLRANGGFETRRQEHAVAVLPSGTVVITGGAGIDSLVLGQPAPGALRSTFLYEPAASRFVRVTSGANNGDMFEARVFHQASTMVNGEMLVSGGINTFAGNPGVAPSTLTTAEVFNTITGWAQSAQPANSFGRGHLFGNMLQFGTQTYLNNGVFIDAQAPPGAQVTGAVVRGFNTACIWPGGSINGQFPGNNGEFFDPNQQPPPPLFQPAVGTTRQPPPGGIILSGATLLATGDIFYAGGENLNPQAQTKNQGALQTTEILRSTTGQYDAGPDIGSSQPPIQLPGGQTAPPTPIPLTEVEVAEIGVTSDVMLIGGVLPNNAVTNIAEQYNYTFNIMLQDPLTGTGIIAMQTARHGHRLAKISGNRIIVIGGMDETQMPPAVYASCEIWTR